MMQSENTAELSIALAKAQGAMKSATFNKTNPHFKSRYADLASVLEAVRKPLSDNGLSVTQTTELRDGTFILVTTLRHATGQWVAGEYPLPSNGNPQQIGSALTYAKRYSLSSMVCIAADEDDDANAATSNGKIKDAVITADQAQQLNELAAQRAVEINTLLELTHSESISDIPAASFARAKAWLEKHKLREVDA